MARTPARAGPVSLADGLCGQAGLTRADITPPVISSPGVTQLSFHDRVGLVPPMGAWPWAYAVGS